MSYKNKCRMCGDKSLEEFLDLGQHVLTNNLKTEEQLDDPEESYPLKVGFCNNCGLIQLLYIVGGTPIYREGPYPFYSSDMPDISEYFKGFAEDFEDNGLENGDVIVEIGSNDGVMLEHLLDDYEPLGVDPAQNVVLRALKRRIPTLSEFFDSYTAKFIKEEWGEAKAVAGANSIAHLDDLNDLMDGVQLLVADDGIVGFEFKYWRRMVEKTNYALIYLEHFTYYSLKDWVQYSKNYDMSVFDAYTTPHQGGNMRVFMSKDDRPKTDRFTELLNKEKEMNLNSLETCREFARKTNERRREIKELLDELKNSGEKLAGYAAASKGLSILHSSDIGKDYLPFIVDDSPAKQGKYTPGSQIPVVSREDAPFEPDYFLILAPNYAEAIMDNNRQFVENGGKWIIPGKDLSIVPE